MEIEVTEGTGTAAPSGGGFGDLLSWASPIGAAVSGVFSGLSARRQEKFQERMDNTKYQRAAADLEAAGLNRVLALGSPGSAPSGASFSVPNIGEAYQAGQSAKQSIAQSKAAESLTTEQEKGAKQQRAFGSEILMEQWKQAKAGTRSAEAQAASDEADAVKQTKLKHFYETLTPEEAAAIEAANSIGSAAGALIPLGKAASNFIRGSTNSAKGVREVERALPSMRSHQLDRDMQGMSKDEKLRFLKNRKEDFPAER